MELEEAFEKVNKIRLNFYDKQYKKSYTDEELTDMCDSLSTILQYIQYDSIPKKIIEDKLLYLMEQLGEADLGDFYDEVRDIKEELLMWELEKEEK